MEAANLNLWNVFDPCGPALVRLGFQTTITGVSGSATGLNGERRTNTLRNKYLLDPTNDGP